MSRVPSRAFVGRAVELAALDEALDRAINGQTSTVLIAGDPGVGKTRLLETWSERAATRGARIAVGSCLDLGESGPAYTAIIEALRDFIASLGDEDEVALVGRNDSALGRIIPELSGESRSTDGPGVISGLAQTRLFDRLADVLQRASSTAPLVLELEDIHWADRSTQSFLVYLVEVSRSARLLLVGTYRPEAATDDPVFRATLAQLARRSRVTIVPVTPFEESELRELLTSVMARPPTNALLAAIHERSEGNPLFAEELAAADDPTAHLPASIAASTAARLESLSEDARAVLRVASVVGRSAAYDIVRKAADIDEAALIIGLREGVRAGLLEPHHAGEAYRFRHALLQDAIYDETLPGERRRLHAAVAHALADDPDQPPEDPMLAPRLARHWFEAGERGRAFLASLAAAGAAERQSAYAEAATHFDRALDLWSEAGAVTRDVDRASVLERAMWASFLAADFDDAIAHGFAALDALGLVPDRSRQIRILDTIERAEGRAAVDEPRGLSIAAEMSPRGLRPIDRMWLRSLHSLHLLERGDLPGAKSIAEPLLAEAESSGDVELQIHVNEVLAIEVAPSDPQRALDLLERARRAAADADDAIRLTEIEVTAGRIMLEHQFYERLRATMPAAIERAGRSGLGRWARPEMHYLLAHACMIDGELQRSWEQVELGRTDMPVGTVRAQLEIIGALVSTAMGEFAQAADCLEASRFPNSTPEAELARGWLATARAELALAERRFDDVASIVNATAPIVVQIGAYTSMTDTIWSLAEVGLAAAAEQAEQARAANDAEALKSMPATVERMTGWVADAHHQRDAARIPGQAGQDGLDYLIAGHVARIENRDEPGPWIAAAEFFQPRSVWSLTARYRQAEAMLATRMPRDDVSAVMVPAYAAAVEIGARPLAQRFEELARRARIDLRAGSSTLGAVEPAVASAEEVESPMSHSALRKRGLSDREIEVLTLVAAGFSNRQIADRLFISDKTASVHVSHIMDKLGVSTRVEAATIGVRLGLPEVD